MKSRTEKYQNDTTTYIQKRTSKNSELYQEINENDLNNINITSNAKVIGVNEDNYVNVDKIKEILERNYHEVPRRSSVKLTEDKVCEEIKLEETREYDINAILEKAREEKEVDYEKERLKRIRDTQYDILKNLELSEEDKEHKAAEVKTKEALLNLINTITENELQKSKMDLDPLDILTDLKGDDDNTVVLGAKEEEFHTGTFVNPIIKETTIPKKSLDDSFYTNSLSFSQSDFDDFNDLKGDVNSSKIVMRILIVFIALAIIAGIVFFLNSFLNLGLF